MSAPAACDVAVVGAGPAGSTLARRVASAGFEVVLLEKQRMPRYKTCAGGVTIRAANLLDFDISPVVERVVDSSRISYKMQRSFLKRYPKPLCFMVMRDRFDALLAQKAQEAGARLVEGVRVGGVRIDDEGCTLRLPEGTLRAKIVVGADGANSIVAHSLGLMKDASADLALEAEVAVAEEALVSFDRLVAIDVGVIRGGYGWVFPKGRHLSIGVAGSRRYAAQLRKYYHDFLAWQRCGPGQVLKFTGHHIPLRNGESPIVKGRALLVGDAAGLADPLSGEGIYYAILSAKLAAPVLARSLQSGSFDLSPYQRAVNQEIAPDLRAAAGLLKAFSRAPGVWVRVIEKLERPWNATCRVLRGEDRWTAISSATGPFRLLLRLMER